MFSCDGSDGAKYHDDYHGVWCEFGANVVEFGGRCGCGGFRLVVAVLAKTARLMMMMMMITSSLEPSAFA